MRLVLVTWLLSCWLAVSAAAQEGWVSYFRDIEGGTVSVLGDLAVHRDRAKLAGGYEIVMTLPLATPNANGMTQGHEADTLFRLEDGVVADIAPLGGRFVGRTTGLGLRVFHMVFPKSTDAAEAETRMAAKAAQHGYQARFQRQRKNPMGAYETVLYPDASGWRQIGDMQVIVALQQAGDILSVPRQITHWCVFTNQASAERFRGWAGGVGYLEPVVMPAEGLWMVRFSHEGTVLPNDISGHTGPLDETCRASGGQYDGWESPVVATE
jgi:hypothetical protein